MLSLSYPEQIRDNYWRCNYFLHTLVEEIRWKVHPDHNLYVVSGQAIIVDFGTPGGPRTELARL